jgi:cytochrome c oxidase subunit 3
MERSSLRPSLDVSDLPEVMFGHSSVSWLGNVFYMAIEGTMFALMFVTYFYLRTRSSDWPPQEAPPALRYGMANLALFVISLVPARWLQRQAQLHARRNVRLGLLIMTGIGAAAIVLRIFEFTTLNCRWYNDAYASTIWVLLGLHAGHLATQWIETLTVTGVSFTEKMEGSRFTDVGINSDYWYFVVASAVIVDVIIYFTTRHIF